MQDNTLDSINDPIDKIDKTNSFKDDLQGIQIQILNNETVSNSAESLPSTSKSDLSSQGLGLGFKRKSVEKLNFESLGYEYSRFEYLKCLLLFYMQISSSIIC